MGNKIYPIEEMYLTHSLEKQNGLTIVKGKKSYDIQKCSKCGIIFHTVGFHGLIPKGKVSEKKLLECDGSFLKTRKEQTGKWITVTHCTAQGEAFSNIETGTSHKIITPPEPYKNDVRGVWIMGVGEPVKILNNEFIFKPKMVRRKWSK